MSNYSSMLRDPRWQRKRLEILKEADFTCQDCGDKTSELQIHHCWYEKGALPWDYDDSCYLCLCAHCHKLRQHYEKQIKMYIAEFSIQDLPEIRDILDMIKVFGTKASAEIFRKGITG